MKEFMKKWGLLGKVFGIVIALLVLRFIIDYFGYDVITLNTLTTAFIGAVIFTIAIIFTGTLTDYKESEKIPSELAASLKSLYMDTRVLPLEDPVIPLIRSHVKNLVVTINSGFRQNRWDIKKIGNDIGIINDDIHILAKKNVAPPFCVKMRVELTTIDRICNRIQTIAETSFIPTAYAIAEISIIAVIFILLFLKIDPYYEGLILFAVISTLIIGILLLIKDMDNPFEVGEGTYADVDLSLLWNLEQDILADESVNVQ